MVRTRLQKSFEKTGLNDTPKEKAEKPIFPQTTPRKNSKIRRRTLTPTRNRSPSRGSKSPTRKVETARVSREKIVRREPSTEYARKKLRGSSLYSSESSEVPMSNFTESTTAKTRKKRASHSNTQATVATETQNANGESSGIQQEEELKSASIAAEKAEEANFLSTYAASLYHWIGGYLFWSLFLALGPMIWFYPLNELDITGYEAFVLSILFPPLLLDFQLPRKLFLSAPGQLLLDALINAGIFSFQAETTLQRLIILAVGAGAAVVKLGTDLVRGDSPMLRRKRCFWGYTMGFFVFLSSRVPYRSFVPTWNDHFSNKVVCSLAVANMLIGPLLKREAKPGICAASSLEKIQSRAQIRSLFVGPAVGSFLYWTHSVFAELSVPSRWVVQPYPNPAPEGMPFGLAILLMMMVGISCSRNASVSFHPLASLALAPGFLALYKLSGWPGFLCGGCLLAFLWGLFLPALFNMLGKTGSKIGRTLFLAILTYLVEIFFAVWTVAYNFVPGGTLTREFTGLNLAVMAVTLMLGLQLHRGKSLVLNNEFNPAFTLKNGCAAIWPWFRVRKDLSLIFLVTCGFMANRYVNYQPSADVGARIHSPQGDAQFTAMIWTYHFGYDNFGWPSLERSAKVMRDLNADIIGLLETDASKAFMGNNDLAAWLGEELDMFVDFGPGTRDHTWGNILLSRFPILNSTHHLLPSPFGELAPALTATLNVSNQMVGIVLSHMGNDGDDLDRKLQAEVLSDLSAEFVERGIPVVFLGYVTSRPGSRDYQTFMSRGKLRDIDESDQDRWCQYIFYGGERIQRLAYARVSHGDLTDTEVQAATFQLLPPKKSEAKTVVTHDSSLVSSWLRFTDSMGDHRQYHYSGSEHRYHMGTPKYFVTPPPQL